MPAPSYAATMESMWTVPASASRAGRGWSAPSGIANSDDDYNDYDDDNVDDDDYKDDDNDILLVPGLEVLNQVAYSDDYDDDNVYDDVYDDDYDDDDNDDDILLLPGLEGD